MVKNLVNKKHMEAAGTALLQLITKMQIVKEVAEFACVNVNRSWS